MENLRIREAIEASGVPYWRVARCLGISNSALSNRLRTKLTPDKEAEILEAVKAVYQERNEKCREVFLHE